MPTIPDFSNQAWHEGRSQSELMLSILDGKGTLMPAFRERIGDEQAQELAVYVRTFAPSKARSPVSSDSNFEKRFRELQAHRRDLQRQLEELLNSDTMP
jgi:hypothetical protein